MYSNGLGAYSDPTYGTVPQQQLPPGTEPAPGYTGPLPGYTDNWWDRSISWLGRKLGLGNVADEDVFWGAAYAGQFMCPGPFTHPQVLTLLQNATPEAVERARQSVYARSWYRKFPPQNLSELAGALIGEAHGGRDCTARDRESILAANAIRGLATEAPAASTGPWPDMPDFAAPTTASLGTLLGMGLLGVGVWFALKPPAGRG